jgi:hypothetical protein
MAAVAAASSTSNTSVFTILAGPSERDSIAMRLFSKHPDAEANVKLDRVVRRAMFNDESVGRGLCNDIETLESYVARPRNAHSRFQRRPSTSAGAGTR